MSLIIISSMFLLNFKIISTAYLNVESNYLKPLSERNNKVNKGVWVRTDKDRFIEKSNTGDFIFRANSLDVDSLLQNNFDAFGDTDMQDSPGVSSYIERSKRSNHYERKRFLRESLNACKGNKECIQKTIKERTKSELTPKFSPTSVFNDYPFEVAILLNDNKLEDISKNIRRVKQSEDTATVVRLDNENPHIIMESLIKNDSKMDKSNYSIEITNNTVATPKRSMKNGYGSDLINKVESIEDFNEFGDNTTTNKFDRGILDKEENGWYQNVKNSDSTYKVGPKYPKNKPINERGLVKVLSMLTKTFKRIMKQHSDIRKIHSKLHSINEEVNRNIVEMNKKLQAMDEKYAFIVTVSNKIKELESNLNIKEEHLKNRDIKMAKNQAEFENQQKKFLIQQRQFYNIQKLMLSQNEKINIKQNLIAKTQSEISHRQNNFARVLKKGKQIFNENKKLSANVHQTTTSKNIPLNATEEVNKITHTSTVPPTTESIKINLFSIPSLNRLENQDSLILKEKDQQPVDELVYKYYFNNTFIDSLMKTKVLSSFVSTPENTEITRNTKSKRNQDQLDNTILLPIEVNEQSEKRGKLQRERRWIRHHSKNRLKKKLRGKNDVGNHEISDSKPIRPRESKIPLADDAKNNMVTKLYGKDSPFVMMAKSFCNEIGQNTNDQMLSWCVEKALRRLQVIDTIMPLPLTGVPDSLKTSKVTEALPEVTTSSSTPKDITIASSTVFEPSVTAITIPSTPLTVTPIIVAASSPANLAFFPDNDELESNLKDFDLRPDNEGNVYYDGSLHASDLAGLADPGDAADGFSDIMPGLDSNSKVEVDPRTFDLQAMRRETVRRINANILNRQRV